VLGGAGVSPNRASLHVASSEAARVPVDASNLDHSATGWIGPSDRDSENERPRKLEDMCGPDSEFHFDYLPYKGP